MQHLQPNTTLQGGRYRIKDVLGQGGFGITYFAKDNSLGVYVAVKEFFMKDLCSRDEATLTMYSSGGSLKQVERYREKFIKEARNLSRLHHLHINSVIDVFEENGTVYYSMPYLKGGSLQDYVKSRGPLTEVEAMKIIRQIADALKYMHEVEHICHYDVKPSNILLDDRGNAMLIDFGIAKNYDESGHETSTTPIGKSEGYAPIEQYQQNVEEFSPASDVYGLGATLLFAMTGKRPTSVIERVGGTPLEMPRYCSEPIKELIFSSMIIQRKYRPQSTKKFLEYDLAKNVDNNQIMNVASPQSEDTITEYKPSVPNAYTESDRQEYTQNNHTQKEDRKDSYTSRSVQTNHKDTTYSRKSTNYSGFLIFLGILVVGILFFFFIIRDDSSVQVRDSSPEIMIEEAVAMRLKADAVIQNHPDEYTDASIYNNVEDIYKQALAKLDDALAQKESLDANAVRKAMQQQADIKATLLVIYKNLDAGAEYIQEFRDRADAIKPYIADILDNQ